MVPFQPSLLEWTRPVAGPRATVQTKELVRVKGRIAELVTAFCLAHVGEEFHLAALTEYVSRFTQVAPDSPRRVLSAMVKAGQVDVRCLSRSESRWAVVAAAGARYAGP